ncbi:hypothetical protein ACFWOT_18030 [Streptomyces sp. NPDC058440]|uniref:hypothetical protein n=1 Tax=Streptomyces sp. NPDC058440 TaxID=3346501 RepID=UPI00364B3F91
MNAPMFACGPCIAELQERVWTSVFLGDEPDTPVIRAEPAGGEAANRSRRGRHRRRPRLPWRA